MLSRTDCPKPARTDTQTLPFSAEDLEREIAELDREIAEDAMVALESMSRKISDLARELNCFGYFDDDDRPRAA